MLTLWIRFVSVCLVFSFVAPAFASGSATANYAITISNTGSTAGVNVSSGSVSGTTEASSTSTVAVTFSPLTVENTGSTSGVLSEEIGAPSGLTENSNLNAANEFYPSCAESFNGTNDPGVHPAGNSFTALSGTPIPANSEAAVQCNIGFSAGTPVGTYNFPVTFTFG